MSLTVTATFDDESKAEDAQSYLLANGFSSSDEVGDQAEVHQLPTANVALRNGCTLTLHLATTLEAQEGVDVLNNYGALTVDVSPRV